MGFVVVPCWMWASLPLANAIVARTDKSQELFIVEQSRYPAVVHLGHKSKKENGIPVPPYSCVGTLIDKQHIVTAAHCFNGEHAGLPVCANLPNGGNCALPVDNPQNTLKVDINGIQNVVTHIFKNTCFILGKDNPNDADLAILKLVNPVDNVDPIPRYTGQDEVGKSFTIAGWGDWGMVGGSKIPNTEGKLFAGQNAFEAVAGNKLVSKLDAADDVIAWSGDGGSPALINVDGTDYLAGVNTGGDYHVHTDVPVSDGDKDVFVRVSSDYTKQWIDSTIVNSSTADLGPCPDWQTKAFPVDCPVVSELKDVTGDPWYGECVGLKQSEGLHQTSEANSEASYGGIVEWTASACSEQCNKDVHCGLWQLVKTKDDKNHCWLGNVVRWAECEKNVQAGKLLQHGYVEVISTNNAQQTLGLNKLPAKAGTITERVDHCRNVCYSDITCTVWQFGKDGCWIEQLPQYPRGKTVTGTDWAEGFIAGETIGHSCTPPVNPEEAVDGGLPLPITLGCIGVAAVALGAVLYALMASKRAREARMKKSYANPHGEDSEDEEDYDESLE